MIKNLTAEGWILRSFMLLALTILSYIFGFAVASLLIERVVFKTIGSAPNADWIWLVIMGLIVGICIASVGYAIAAKLVKPSAWFVFWLGTVAVTIVFIFLLWWYAEQFPPNPTLLIVAAGIAGMLIGLIQWSQLLERPTLSLLWILAATIAWMIVMCLGLIIASLID